MNQLETIFIDITMIFGIVILGFSIAINVISINIIYLLQWIFKWEIDREMKMTYFFFLIFQLNVYILLEWVRHLI